MAPLAYGSSKMTYFTSEDPAGATTRKPADEKRESIPVLPFAVNHLSLRPRNAAPHLTTHRSNRPCRIPFAARRG
ncbi:hypothetical protein F01_310039 [Burkholderia cenocepacia]|nr:hypothetical protein F01_310039 [Burkholderia cenocepacia]